MSPLAPGPWLREVEELLSELCAIDSTNDGPDSDRPVEAAMALRVRDFLEKIGLEVETRVWKPGRECVLGALRGRGGPSLALEAHLDTVPVTGCEELLEPRRSPRGLTARGAVDTKGSLAAMLVAFKLFAATGREPAGDLFLWAVPSEETGCEGARFLVSEGVRAGGVVVGEPTGLEVVRRHKGTVWGTITTRGRSCHGSRPELGENAIVRMARLLEVLDREDRGRLAASRDSEGISRTINWGTIRGGTKINIVPDRCSLEVDLRTLPAEEPGGVAAELGEAIERHSDRLGIGPVGWEWAAHGGLDTDPASDVFTRVSRALSEVRGSTTRGGTVSYFADSGVYGPAGMPSVLLGPGDIAQAHTDSEFLAWEELHEAVRVYEAVLETES